MNAMSRCVFPASVWKREQSFREGTRTLENESNGNRVFSTVFMRAGGWICHGTALAKWENMNGFGDFSEPIASTASRAPSAATDKRRLRVWMVDDHASFREGFAQLLSAEPGLRVARQFGSVQPLLAALAEERPPDIVLLDLNIGKENGLTAI